MKSLKKDKLCLLNAITRRAFYFAMQMIYLANNRDNIEKGDPKVGGHPTASASSLHLLGVLHLAVKSGFDYMAIKPHTSPTDHAFNYLLDLFLDKNKQRMSEKLCERAMHGLRAFSDKAEEPVFQSYHSKYDPDHEGYLPSGTVGIPPVNLGYLALAYDYLRHQGFKVPESAHFWAVIGDSEFREGSLFEAMPDFAERQISHLTWIIDYNRQSLDGQRITNMHVMGGNDHDRIAKTALVNGWDVIQVQHGSFRKQLFQKKGGQVFQEVLEKKLEDLQFQALLLSKDFQMVRDVLLKADRKIEPFLKETTDQELQRGLQDLGGHDYAQLIPALEKSKACLRPCLIIAHTIKGWGLLSAAQSANHNVLIPKQEIMALMQEQNLSVDRPFEKFSSTSQEGQFLKKRGDELFQQIQGKQALKDKNQTLFQKQIAEMPESLDVNLKWVNYPHTQWMLGQLMAKLTRIASHPKDNREKLFQVPARLMVLMSPDVGTSTNLNPAMDDKIFGSMDVSDYELKLNVKDRKSPTLIPGTDVANRFLRFEITEANSMSCMGSFGKIKDTLGIPLMPLMTVYDFFIKRALDQYFYNLYWDSRFMLFGTPSGITLSPEGAQHGWKSDFQIPHQITWEPFFCQELDWIFVDSLRRHFLDKDQEHPQRTGILIRATTRGVDQKQFLTRLKQQMRFKMIKTEQPLHPAKLPTKESVDESSLDSLSDEDIFKQIRNDILSGGYYLINYSGYVGYEPGDNVVNLFAMGSPTTEAIEASDALLAKGIYANVVVVTSSDLLIGHLGFADNYKHLRKNLDVDASLHLKKRQTTKRDLTLLAGRRVPIVSVHDGEPGLLDNIGSIVGVCQKSLAVRKHSKCGRPRDIYAYHGIDCKAIVKAVEDVLWETAKEDVFIR